LYRCYASRVLEAAPVEHRFDHLFSFDTIADLRSLAEDSSVGVGTTKVGLRRLINNAAVECVKRQAAAITNEIDLCEKTSLAWRGVDESTKVVPYWLAGEDNQQRRRHQISRWVNEVSGCNDLHLERCESFRTSARRLGFASYSDLMSNATETDFEYLQH